MEFIGLFIGGSTELVDDPVQSEPHLRQEPDRFGLGYWIYYKYTLRPPLWIPLVLGEVRSFWNLRDSSRQFYPLDYHARGTRSSSTGSIWIFLRNAACYGFGARRARAADIRILAYRDIAMGVKFDSEASWILDKDP